MTQSTNKYFIMIKLFLIAGQFICNSYRIWHIVLPCNDKIFCLIYYLCVICGFHGWENAIQSKLHSYGRRVFVLTIQTNLEKWVFREWEKCGTGEKVINHSANEFKIKVQMLRHRHNICTNNILNEKKPTNERCNIKLCCANLVICVNLPLSMSVWITV